MINELVFEAPLNPLSLGVVSTNLLKSFKRKNIKVHLAPIGNIDLNHAKVDDELKNYIQVSLNNFNKSFKRSLPTIRNWHLNGSHSFTTDYRYLLTYHELDTISEEEINIIRNTNKTFFCGVYSPTIFKGYGLDNKIDSFNLALDTDSFYKVNKKFFDDNRIHWLLAAKCEKRKHSLQTLSLWAKKYGKKMGESYKPSEQMHFLSVQITNPFYDIKVQEQQIAQALSGERYCNIQFFQFLDRESFNQLLNSCNFDLSGLSGGESWSLIPFTMANLGRWPIVLDCSGTKSWANNTNSILISPSGKEPAADGIFFAPSEQTQFNKGNIFTYSNSDVEEAMDLAVNKYNRNNDDGEKLATEFTYDKTVDYILTNIEKDLNSK